MRHGLCCPPGFLPVFSVNNEEEAKRLLAAACPTNLQGEYVAPELAENQTIERLFAFGRRLEKMYDVMFPVEKPKPRKAPRVRKKG